MIKDTEVHIHLNDTTSYIQIYCIILLQFIPLELLFINFRYVIHIYCIFFYSVIVFCTCFK